MTRFVGLLVSVVLVAPAAAGQLTLTWTDNASDEQGFKIERCTVTAVTSAPAAPVDLEVQ